ncbi:13396_t:CDS:2, partial [Racocetra persica]
TPMCLNNDQQSDSKSDHDNNKTDELVIQSGAEFSNWKSLENSLKKYELKIGFKSIKYRVESENVGCEWQLNVGYRKNINAIVVNKFVESHNHSFTPYRKEFAPSLCLLSQDVLDAIKFLTQECNLGAKAQRQYILKKFLDQPLFDCNLYNAIR